MNFEIILLMTKILKILLFQINVNSYRFISNIYHKLFVYGTLKRNEPNHNWLTNPDHGKRKFIGEGMTKTKYPLLVGTKHNIPYLLKSPGNGHHVQGEVYEVDDRMLGKLDILENHPNFYVRELDDIILKKGKSQEELKCWIYFLKEFRRELLSKPRYQNYSSKGSHGLEFKRGPKTHSDDDYK